MFLRAVDEVSQAVPWLMLGACLRLAYDYIKAMVTE